MLQRQPRSEDIKVLLKHFLVWHVFMQNLNYIHRCCTTLSPWVQFLFRAMSWNQAIEPHSHASRESVSFLTYSSYYSTQQVDLQYYPSRLFQRYDRIVGEHKNHSYLRCIMKLIHARPYNLHRYSRLTDIYWKITRLIN